MYLRLIACGLLVAPASLLAQSVVPASARADLGAATGSAVLRTGTQVPLRLLEAARHRRQEVARWPAVPDGNRAPVMVDGMTVVPTGTPVQITDVRNKGMSGQVRRLAARVCR